MAKKPILTLSRLRQLLEYNPRTGDFIFLVTRGGVTPGTVAGSPCRGGYIRILIEGRLYAAHRLAWLNMTGSFPAFDIDHINGVRSDNRWCNLREATRAENMQNYPVPKTSTSGLMGATWHKANGRWRAQIKVGGVKRHLGYFDSPEEAHGAYLVAKAALHTFNPSVRAPV